MNQEELIGILQEIFDDIFDETQPKVVLDLSSSDVQEWDSLANIQLIVAIEHQFSIKFAAHEVEKLSSVRDLINSINTKI